MSLLDSLFLGPLGTGSAEQPCGRSAAANGSVGLRYFGAFEVRLRSLRDRFYPKRFSGRFPPASEKRMESLFGFPAFSVRRPLCRYSSNGAGLWFLTGDSRPFAASRDSAARSRFASVRQFGSPSASAHRSAPAS